MKREIKITSDGSSTIHLPDWNENYHSTHGAIQEANYVFLKQGFSTITTSEIAVLEIGFGTGLNCFLTFLETDKMNTSVDYVGVEAYPVTENEYSKLNYVTELKASEKNDVFIKMHNCSWDVKHELSPSFSLIKRKQFFKEIEDKDYFDLVYFDAFGAEHQPDLWTAVIFKKMYQALKLNGVLVTYSAKGSVRRAMQGVGFTVERLEGPPGKREMLRATKIAN